MTDLDRFIAMCAGEKPDYVPIFGFPGAPGMSRGCMLKTHQRLVETGMPPHVGGTWRLGQGQADVESWFRYWGTTGPISPGFGLGRGAKGFKTTRRIEGEHEIIESESGALTRQLIDNDITYSMPEFIAYPVRDRDSWGFYKERQTSTDIMPPDEMDDRPAPAGLADPPQTRWKTAANRSTAATGRSTSRSAAPMASSAA